MKKNNLRLCSLLLLLAVVLGGLMACTHSDVSEDTQAETSAVTNTDGTQAETQAVVDTQAGTEGVTDAETEPTTSADTEAVTEAETRRELTWETYDPALDSSSVDTSAAHIVDPTQWVAVDGLDRVLPTNTQTGDARDKTVAIFYWTWHGDFAGGQYAYNNQNNLDILSNYDLPATDYFNIPAVDLSQYGIYTADASAAKYHFWNEPVFGYYDGDDEWVIRKQAEMLAAAGVDVVFFDNTNGEFTWLQTAKKVMKVFSEARAQGVDAPDVSFMLPFGPVKHSGNQMIQLYTQIYEKGLYKDVWYMLDGKPMLMAWPGSFDTENLPAHAEYASIIRNFFTFRSNIGNYDDKTTASNFWGWLSVFPQQIYYNDQKQLEQITVGVAINHNYVDHVIAPMSGENIIGRTWTSKGYDTRKNAHLYGACFAEQWENAITVDPEIVFVTGWNEWVAMKLQHWTGDYYNCFVDQYNDEFSRDCEPSNGPLKDHYYYQLISYIRQYKGTNPIEVASPEKLMDVNGGFGQWADVGPTYTDYFGLTNRDFNGYLNPETNQPLHYTNDTGRNDIYDAKVARDYENVYFMVRTVNELTPYTDPDWMRLYISTGDSDKAWEGYEFVLNKTAPTATEATLEAFTGDGYETTEVGKVKYTVKGNVMMVEIPKTMLGIPADVDHFTFDFKWVDNANEDEDGNIMLWYSNGDVAPIGRFNYCYTTDAFDENTARPVYGWQSLDLTDASIQATLDAALKETAKNEAGEDVTVNVKNMTYSFDEKGLTMTSTDAASNKLVLDYSKAPAHMVGDHYGYVAITYVCNDPDVTSVKIGFGAGVDVSVATYTRGKSMDVNGDGTEHTVILDLTKLRGWSGYVHEVGFFFDKTLDAGASITISGIEFMETAPADAE